MTNDMPVTLTRPALTRKQQFDTALIAAQMTQVRWRTEVYRVSKQHLTAVLNGDRVGGDELNEAIDALIRKYLPESVAA